MSYDLHFRAEDGSPPGRVQLAERLRAIPHMTESGSAQFQYRHPQTGVYCTFELEEEVPLTASLNFVRPRFFGSEIMPLIAQLAAFANLRIFDPQEDKLYESGVAAQVLEADWASQNELITRAMLREGRIRSPYLPEEQSLYWWRYSYAKEEFQRSLREDIFVPSIFLFAHADGKVRTAATWSAEVRNPLPLLTRYVPLPQIFPACDYLILAYGKKGAKVEKRYVSYAVAIERLQGMADEVPEPSPVPGLRILRAASQARAGSVFAALPSADTGKMERIASDGFVDVAP